MMISLIFAFMCVECVCVYVCVHAPIYCGRQNSKMAP